MSDELFTVVLDIVKIMVTSLSSFHLIGPLTLLDVIVIGSVVTLILVNFVRGGD